MGGEGCWASSDDRKFDHSALLAVAIRRKRQVHPVWRRIPIFEQPVPCGPAAIAFEDGHAIPSNVRDVNGAAVRETVDDNGTLVVGANGIGHDPDVGHLTVPIRGLSSVRQEAVGSADVDFPGTIVHGNVLDVVGGQRTVLNREMVICG